MKRRKVITLILLSVFVVGLGVLLYPSISSYWNSITQSRAIVDYDTIMKSLSPKDYSKLYAAADEYNEKLAALKFPLAEYEQVEGYDECLNAAQNGVMVRDLDADTLFNAICVHTIPEEHAPRTFKDKVRALFTRKGAKK